VRATLIHNPSAGAGDRDTADLVRRLERVGFATTAWRGDPESLAGCLADPGDLVVVAGGDGTVATIARRLAGTGVPMAVLPLGSANNIARSLGLVGGPEHLIAALPRAARRVLDVGLARGPWGEHRFLESAGIGLFARMLAVMERSPDLDEAAKRDPGFEPALHVLRELLAHPVEPAWRVRLDGREIPGPLLLLEAMNMRFVGPHLHLAPGADPGDGLLDVVVARTDRRAALAEYLAHRLEGEATLPGLEVVRGRRIEIAGGEREIHFDDETWTGAARGGERWAEIEAAAARLEVLVPGL